MSSPPKVGIIGRISPWKGQDVFIRAAAELRDNFPNAVFQIMGAPLFSEHEYEVHLKHMVMELGLTEQVEFTGFVSDVQAAIAQMQIVVHASTVGEPFGQVVIEGMAAGKPVIATNGGGIPEIVEDQVSGILVPMGDAPALANAIATLLRDPELARKIGARARQRVRERFTIERTARKVEQVYEEILAASLPGDFRRTSLAPNGADVEL